MRACGDGDDCGYDGGCGYGDSCGYGSVGGYGDGEHTVAQGEERSERREMLHMGGI